MSNSTESAQLLLERGAEIKVKNEDNNTPLDLARCNTGNNEAIIRLLREHALNTS